MSQFFCNICHETFNASRNRPCTITCGHSFCYSCLRDDYLKNNYRVSLRSNGIDIEKVAMKYQGGGHKCASGARLNSLDEVDNLISDLDNLLP